MTSNNTPSILLVSLLTVTFAPHVFGGYVITTPRQWNSGMMSELCVTSDNPAAPESSLTLTLLRQQVTAPQENETLSATKFFLPAGESHLCYPVVVPETDQYYTKVLMSGSVGGDQVNRTFNAYIRKQTSKIFLQTDKYLYQPGQLVQLRALTVTGPGMTVSTQEYPEVWVTNPSRTRIAQWKNVNNSAGLVHLDFRLTEEPEEGLYTVHVRPSKGYKKTVSFKVEEFVLPRFEVTVKPPSYILATEKTSTFTVCANYTFGKPVKGNLSITFDNNRYGNCKRLITRNLSIDGCREVEISSRELQINKCRVSYVNVQTNVSESGTLVSLKGPPMRESITRSPIRFITVYKDRFIKPNLPYTIKVRTENPDGSVAVSVPLDVCIDSECTNMTTAADGLVTAVISTYSTNIISMMSLNCRAYMEKSIFEFNLQRYFSPSNSSLLIHAPEDKIACAVGQEDQHVLPVWFSARNQSSASITVQVISRGRIQHTSTQVHQLVEGPLPIKTEHLVEPLHPPLPGTIRGVVNVTITLPPMASPTARVLVWYTREDGEIVSDARELKVDKCLPHNVSLKWSTKRAQPGDAANITITAEPDAVCSLGVVDRSTELLNIDPDPISLDKLFDFADDFRISLWAGQQVNDHQYCHKKHDQQQQQQQQQQSETTTQGYSSNTYIRYDTEGYVDALKMFDEFGVYVFTDYTVETRPCNIEVKEIAYTTYYSTTHRPTTPFITSRPPSATFQTTTITPSTTTNIPNFATDSPTDVTVEESGEEHDQSETYRTNFPETWLWDLVVVLSSGVHEQPVTVPDTITQWMGKAVCVHPQKGVGLSDRQPLTTFTPFFVDLTLPPTIKRGEILPVKMSIFNYLNQQLQVNLTLEDSSEYEILEEVGLEGQRGKRSTSVPPQDKVVITVKIKPSVIADVNISVSAVVDQQSSAGVTALKKRDALIKPIKVEAEGLLQEKSWTKYICSDDLVSGDDSLEAWQLVLPTTLVEGSARGWVTAVGDLLALSLENLGHLIRMPYGCGEQNMVDFAPNIYVLRYLEQTQQTTPEARTKLVNHMTKGYRRELLYRRNDGSYSAFGMSDDSGSTWLTAFVLKSFAQAQPYVEIDNESQNETRIWLQQRQAPDGCFISEGKLLNKGLQGGVSSSKTPAPLTAYILAALVEAGEETSSPAVSEAVKCLAADTDTHPYTLALKAYALALAQLPEAAATLQQLMGLATVTNNSIHWELPTGSGNSKAIGLETAAYGLLAMMTYDPENQKPQARKVIKWMTAQRNGQGGFYSTQDTVVALQALATFESHLHQGPLNVQATVTANNFSHVFSVTDDNKLVEQLEPLPSMPTQVSITMAGQGCVVLQAVQRYNIPDPEPSDAFNLTVSTTTAPDDLCITKLISICASYRLPDTKSNMAVIEVDLISGYIPEKKDLKKLVRRDRNLKRYEVDGSKINFYIDELTASETCVRFRVQRMADVEEVKAGTVIVYDYYQPEFSISKRYTLPPPEECL